jgi:oligopeptide transport system ATP-binding protein
MAPLLAIRDLHVRFRVQGREREAARGIDLSIGRGETVAIVGESGSGKTQTMMAAIGMLPENGSAVGSVRFEGREILGLSERELNRLRGFRVTMIFQEPMTALDPLYPVGAQVMAPIIVHGRLSKAAARRRPCRPRPAGATLQIGAASIVRRPTPARDDRHGHRQ